MFLIEWKGMKIFLKVLNWASDNRKEGKVKLITFLKLTKGSLANFINWDWEYTF